MKQILFDAALSVDDYDEDGYPVLPAIEVDGEVYYFADRATFDATVRWLTRQPQRMPRRCARARSSHRHTVHKKATPSTGDPDGEPPSPPQPSTPNHGAPRLGGSL